MNMLSGAGKRYGLKKLTALIIMDGFGCNPDSYGNAIMPQNTKHLRTIWDAYPHTQIGASGRDVGLPSGQMGNSEVGHTNIGAGRVVFQDLTRIFDLAESGRLGSCTAVREAFENCREHSSALHLMGLLSDGGVHSHIDHLFALLDAAKAAGMQKVFVHCFTDGRDTAVDSGLGFVRALKDKLAECGCGKIATVEGRYYAMDRNNNYDRTEKAYSALVYGEGDMFSDAEEAVKASYRNGVTDEFIKPCVITENGEPVAKINANDSIIFFNFRPDRARQLTRCFIDRDFPQFERRRGYFPVKFVCMSQYSAEFNGRVSLIVPPEQLSNTMGEYLSSLGKTQLRIAETEKYAHVTFFLNGGREEEFEGEDRILVASPKVATYDLQPEMSAYEVADKLVGALDRQKYDFICLNFANGDMVGHTGVYEAIEKAVKAVDACVAKVVEAALRNGYEVVQIADHGNADNAVNADGTPNTAHSLNPVPIVVVSDRVKTVRDGILADVAPTVLDLMGLEKPEAMTGHSLVEFK